MYIFFYYLIVLISGTQLFFRRSLDHECKVLHLYYIDHQLQKTIHSNKKKN